MNEWEKLLMEARRAVNAVSNYAERTGFESQMYEANKAWLILNDLPERPTLQQEETRERG